MEKQEKNLKTEEETIDVNTAELDLESDDSENYDNEEGDTGENQDDAVDTSELKIKELTDQVDDLKDRLLRQMAESENIRTRLSKTVEETKEYAIFGFTKDLVSVMDNLSRALEHVPDDLDDNAKNIIEGVKMTKQEFESVFKKHKLESIEPQSGDKFDYNNHHAISQVVTDECKEGSIVDTMQIGYKIKDRLIRPAAVVVAKAK